MSLEPSFWEKKSLTEMNSQEWEALCDGCGQCCYHKFMTGKGRRAKVHFTRIACNQLNLSNGKCCNYAQRFQLEPDCIKLTRHNLPEFGWLPPTCAYRLLYENKPLYSWHPLISGRSESVQEANIPIKNGIHEHEVIDWFDYVIDPPK